jgi:hypothetical protein
MFEFHIEHYRRGFFQTERPFYISTDLQGIPLYIVRSEEAVLRVGRQRPAQAVHEQQESDGPKTDQEE